MPQNLHSTNNRTLRWNSFGSPEHTFATVEKGNGLDLKIFLLSCLHRSTMTHTFASFPLYHIKDINVIPELILFQTIGYGGYYSLLTTPLSILIHNQVLRFGKRSSTLKKSGSASPQHTVPINDSASWSKSKLVHHCKHFRKNIWGTHACKPKLQFLELNSHVDLLSLYWLKKNGNFDLHYVW